MFIALDKLQNQGLRQAVIVVPERAIGASFHDEPLTQFGFWADWTVAPRWNLCDAPGSDNGGKVGSVGAFLDSDDKVLVCTHATFRFAVDRFGVEAFGSSEAGKTMLLAISVTVPMRPIGMRVQRLLAEPVQGRLCPDCVRASQAPDRSYRCRSCPGESS